MVYRPKQTTSKPPMPPMPPKGGSSADREDRTLRLPIMILKLKEVNARKNPKSSYELLELIYCEDCKFRRWEEDEEYYYCALEDRPNRNWSVDKTDFCSWGERKDEYEDKNRQR